MARLHTALLDQGQGGRQRIPEQRGDDDEEHARHECSDLFLQDFKQCIQTVWLRFD